MCRRTGATYRQLDYWVRTGMIRPSLHPGNGCGMPRRWSEDDVARIGVVCALMQWTRDAGGPSCRARQVVQALTEMPVDSGFLVVDPEGGVAWARNSVDLGMRASLAGPTCVVINLAALNTATERAAS
ncbi:MAG: MerR family transcriptional regulator [Chloroflexi bacterium]|nr:MerR family transcriptional regulator [Chloroflexota bacterium]